ncbi:MAG: YibE/F family protein [Syntrophomonadaceae bacterium]
MKCEQRRPLVIIDFQRLMAATVLGVLLVLNWVPAVGAQEPFEEHYSEAVVINIIESSSEQIDPDNWIVEQEIEVRLVSGEYQGETIIAKNSLSGTKGMDIELKPGDRVIVYSAVQDNVIQESYIAERVRAPFLKYFVLFFALVLVAVGGVQGIKALVGLGFTMAGIYYILLPALLKGYAPLPITIAVLIGVTFFTMVVIAGFSRKAAAATLGTLGGLLVAGFLAVLVGDLAALQGLGTEEERILSMVDLPLDMRGLLFAGILIGAVGAVMDVAMSISSAIEEVHIANPDLGSWELVRSGMRVGRDIMGTMANTLILAYTGGSLPFLLLYLAYELPPAMILNSELIGAEVIRALAGSIGLIVSVPITAVIAGLLNRSNIGEGYERNTPEKLGL